MRPPLKVGAWSDAFISKVLVATFEVMEARGVLSNPNPNPCP
jgi:hypothetical protein